MHKRRGETRKRQKKNKAREEAEVVETSYIKEDINEKEETEARHFRGGG